MDVDMVVEVLLDWILFRSSRYLFVFLENSTRFLSLWEKKEKKICASETPRNL